MVLGFCEVFVDLEFALACWNLFSRELGPVRQRAFVTVWLRRQRRRASLELFDGRRTMVTVGADDSLCDRHPLTSNSFHSPSDGVYSSMRETLAVVPSGSDLPARECGGVPCQGPRRKAIDSSRREPSPRECAERSALVPWIQDKNFMSD